jgi:phosphoglycolate phosphatase
MNRHLFIDFDGTLIDSRLRQYELFVELIGNTSLTLSEYWNDKRAGIKQSDMLLKYAKYALDDMREFKGKWMEAIEDPKRLQTDNLIAGAPEFLGEASRHFQLYLVTGRQHRERLIEQMQKLRIESYFTGILNTAQSIPKAQLVRANVELADSDVFIGDSGEDILAGKELGLLTVGVTSGACNAERIKRYEPNLTFASVAELAPQDLGVF